MRVEIGTADQSEAEARYLQTAFVAKVENNKVILDPYARTSAAGGSLTWRLGPLSS